MDMQLRQLWRDCQSDDLLIHAFGNTMQRTNLLIDPVELYKKQLAINPPDWTEDQSGALVCFYPLLPKEFLEAADPSRDAAKKRIEISWRTWVDGGRGDSFIESWNRCQAPESMLHVIHQNDGLSHRLLLTTHALLSSVTEGINPYGHGAVSSMLASYARTAYDSFSALASNEFYCFLLNVADSGTDEGEQKAVERANIIRKIIPVPTKDPSYFRQEKDGN